MMLFCSEKGHKEKRSTFFARREYQIINIGNDPTITNRNNANSELRPPWRTSRSKIENVKRKRRPSDLWW